MRCRCDGLFSTYSIVARDPETGQLGVAVQTHQMCVGRVVPWLSRGVGAIATQSMANVSFWGDGAERAARKRGRAARHRRAGSSSPCHIRS